MKQGPQNTTKQRRLWNRSDGILILSLLVLALCAAFGYSIQMGQDAGAGILCDVYLNGSVVRTISLEGDQEFSLPEKPQVVFQVRDGAIAFVRSDCPDKVCVHAGFLGEPGQSAACLPNKLVLRVRGNDGPDVVIK